MDSSESEEKMIVKSFLEIHGIQFNNEELIKESQESKTDIVFRDCFFQLKKIIYPDGYKPKDVEPVQTETECLQPEFLQQLIIKKTFYWSERNSNGKLKYPSEIRSNLDLLFYIQTDLNKIRFMELIFDEEISKKLEMAGWRSVSYLFGSKSLVLYLSDHAPSILRRIYFQQN